MPNEFGERLKSVNQSILNPLVRRALNNDLIEVTAWSHQSLKGGYSNQTVGGYGTYRFTGQARVGDEVVSWSLILKVLGKTANIGSENLTDWDYWKREILAYQSGLLNKLPGGLSAPHCFEVVEYPDNEFWIWLEEIPQAGETQWTMERFGLAARHLGQFNGAYLVGEPLPDEAWLSKGRVRNWLKSGEHGLRDIRRYLEYPLVRGWFGESAVNRTLNLLAEKDSLLQLLEQLPRTLCHHDAFPRNLLTRLRGNGTEETVAIDWQILGTGAIGEEIAPLIGVSLQFFECDMAQAAELDTVVFEGYLAGLRDMGWIGDARMVRFGFSASAALFLGVGAAGHWMPGFADEQFVKSAEEVLGQSREVIIARFGALQTYLLNLGDEARKLRELL